jgi:hypothetical protein
LIDREERRYSERKKGRHGLIGYHGHTAVAVFRWLGDQR